ncbi:MAG: hypothetical protein R2705_24610 [Ilumatobacteraceae bacterium]
MAFGRAGGHFADPLLESFSVGFGEGETGSGASGEVADGGGEVVPGFEVKVDLIVGSVVGGHWRCGPLG